MNPTLFFFGGCRVRVGAEDRTAVLNLCLARGTPYTDFSVGEDGSVSFSLPLLSARGLIAAASARGICVQRECTFGLVPLLGRLLRRPGLLAGGLFGIFLLFLSGRFVWAVEVTGNERMSDGEVREILDACEFGVGTYLPGLEIPPLENRVLLSTDRLSWISINVSGTVARVQVVERVTADAGEGTATRPAHLVASRDGQIEYFEIFRGVRAVSVGQAVRAGEVLVSGIYPAGEGEDGVPARYTRAAGRVMARTEREVELFVPYAWEEKVRGKPSTVGLCLHFFNFSWNFFENSRNTGGSCDIIETEKVLPSVGQHEIPISLTVKEAFPYSTVSRTRTEGEALVLAYEELEEELASLSGDVTLLEKSVRTELCEDGVRLHCTLRCLENIACVRELEIGEQEE